MHATHHVAQAEAISADRVEMLLTSLLKESKASVHRNLESRTILADLFDIEKLQLLHNLFVERNKAEKVDDDLCITAEDFKGALLGFIPKREVEHIYAMIDTCETGKVAWQELTNFLIAMESSNRKAEGHETHQYALHETQAVSGMTHRDAVETMCYCAKPSPMIVSGGRDGRILIWDPRTLSSKGRIRYLDKNEVYLKALTDRCNQEQKCVLAMTGKVNQSIGNRDNYMITCLASMTESAHLLVGSADSSLSCYDLSNLDVCGRYVHMLGVPTTVEVVYIEKRDFSGAISQAYSHDKEHNDHIQEKKFTPLIVVGDSVGCLHFISLDVDFKSCTDAAQKAKNEYCFAQATHHVPKLHVKPEYTSKNWITCVKYLPEMQSLAVSLYDGDIAIIDYEKHVIRQIYRGHHGSVVRSIAWSSSNRYVCSVGERKILVWYVFNFETIISLGGLSSSAVAAEIGDAESKIFVAASDSTVLIFHTITFELLQVIKSSDYINMDAKLEQELSGFLFAPSLGYFYSATNLISLWRLERRKSGELSGETSVQKHDDICTVLYNKILKTIISVAFSGLVSVYNIEDGSDCNRFFIRRTIEDRKILHSSKSERDELGVAKFILQATLDATDKRLIVLTCHNTIQFWNFTCGSMIFEVRPQVPVAISHLITKSREPFRITTLSFEIVHTSEETLRFLILGTNCGFVCCLAERNFIDDEPTFSLVRNEELIASLENSRPGIDSSRQRTSSSKNEQLHVLQSRYIGDSRLAVAYTDGNLYIWDLERAVTLHCLDTNATGIALNGMLKSAARCKTFAPSRGNAEKTKKIQNKSKVSKALEIMLKAAYKSSDNESDDDEQSSTEVSDSLSKASESESTAKKVTVAAGNKALTVSASSAVPTRPSLFLNVRPSLRARLTIPKLDFTKLDLNISKFTENKTFVAEIVQEPTCTTKEINRLERMVTSLLSSVDKASNHNHHILLIDSSIVCLKFMTRYLQHAGYKVTSTSDPQAAFDFLDSDHLSFSIIIIDIYMPDTRGNLLAKYVMSLHLKSVVILTSSSTELEVEARRLGAMAFLRKPCDIKELFDICRQVLDPNFTSDYEEMKKDKEKRNIVINLIFLESSYVLIGICSDGLLRFWDLGTARILCACVVDDFEEYRANQANKLSKDAVVGRHVQSIVASYNEATLAAAYDDGIIRVFDVLISSIDALRAALYDQMEIAGEGHLVLSAMKETMKNRYVSVTSVSKGMAVSPLKLISEWRAHEATILSLNYISLADTPAVSSFRPPVSETDPDRFSVSEDPASYEKDEYIVSSGMDQMVYLWDIHGKLIGVFGHDDWKVENPKSYKESDYSFHTKQKQPVGLQPIPPESIKPSDYQSQQKGGRTLEEKISWREYRDKVRGIGSSELNKYVASLRKKPPIGVLDAQCDEYQLLTDKHPISKVETMEAAFKAGIPAYDRSGIERKRRAKITRGVGKAAGKFLRSVHKEYRPSSS